MQQPIPCNVDIIMARKIHVEKSDKIMGTKRFQAKQHYEKFWAEKKGPKKGQETMKNFDRNSAPTEFRTRFFIGNCGEHLSRQFREIILSARYAKPVLAETVMNSDGLRFSNLFG